MHGRPGCNTFTRQPWRTPISARRPTQAASPWTSATSAHSPQGIISKGISSFTGASHLVEIESQYTLAYPNDLSRASPIFFVGVQNSHAPLAGLQVLEGLVLCVCAPCNLFCANDAMPVWKSGLGG